MSGLYSSHSHPPSSQCLENRRLLLLSLYLLPSKSGISHWCRMCHLWGVVAKVLWWALSCGETAQPSAAAAWALQSFSYSCFAATFIFRNIRGIKSQRKKGIWFAFSSDYLIVVYNMQDQSATRAADMGSIWSLRLCIALAVEFEAVH